MFKFIGKTAGYGILFLLALLVVGLGWATARYFSFEEAVDEAHLKAKQDYLAGLAGHDLPASAPNLVVILFDDLGYGDLGAFGARAIATPHIDQLAADGMMLTQYFAPSPFCTPSRAGLLTGRLPLRSNLQNVDFPNDSPVTVFTRVTGTGTELPRDEITLAEVLRAVGYQTHMVGKWHLGDTPGTRPNDFGFEGYYGLLHSNDMTPIPLMRNEDIAEAHPIDQRFLTGKYTDEAVAFIERSAGKPFFLYMPHNFPHIPLYPNPDNQGQSRAGEYGDVVEDLDRSVGAVMAALKDAGVADNTIVVLTSDNGPWFQGSNGGDVRGRKGESFDGGQRVPFIAKWPARIAPGGSSNAIAMGTDLMPTMAGLLNIPLPDDRIIDGKPLTAVLTENAPTPHDHLLLINGPRPEAVRAQNWKWQTRKGIVPGTSASDAYIFMFPKGPWLFDMQVDSDESYDVSMKHPEKAAAMKATFDAFLAEMESNPRGWK